jgi:hypothetical protein
VLSGGYSMSFKKDDKFVLHNGDEKDWKDWSLGHLVDQLGEGPYRVVKVESKFLHIEAFRRKNIWRIPVSCARKLTKLELALK